MRINLVAIVGEANSGKSTLINNILGEKISIVSPKAQTTRNNIHGIKSINDTQIVFVDTPGFVKQNQISTEYFTKMQSQHI